MLNTDAWLDLLREQLPGWKVWVIAGPVGRGWRAVPAPASTPMVEAIHMDHRVSADTPHELRTLCRERYGWDDTCETCGTSWRECGHRQPERDRSNP